MHGIGDLRRSSPEQDDDGDRPCQQRKGRGNVDRPDQARGGGDATAARAVFVGAAMLVAASIVPAFLGLSWLYAAAAVGGGALLMLRTAQLALEPTRARALASFHASLIQLSLLIVAAGIEPLLRA